MGSPVTITVGAAQLVNIVRVRNLHGEHDVWVDTFRIAEGIKDVEKALRDAVKAFLKTEAGKKAVQETHRDFNWGDAMVYLSSTDLAKYGIERVATGSKDIVVDQDEVLCNEEE